MLLRNRFIKSEISKYDKDYRKYKEKTALFKTKSNGKKNKICNNTFFPNTINSRKFLSLNKDSMTNERQTAGITKIINYT
jgi:hypothetical protein